MYFPRFVLERSDLYKTAVMASEDKLLEIYFKNSIQNGVAFEEYFSLIRSSCYEKIKSKEREIKRNIKVREQNFMKIKELEEQIRKNQMKIDGLEGLPTLAIEEGKPTNEDCQESSNLEEGCQCHCKEEGKKEREGSDQETIEELAKEKEEEVSPYESSEVILLRIEEKLRSNHPKFKYTGFNEISQHYHVYLDKFGAKGILKDHLREKQETDKERNKLLQMISTLKSLQMANLKA